MPESKQWAYVLHQAYGDIPSVTFYDDNTLDAFTSHSTWAFAEGDDPFRDGIEKDDVDGDENQDEKEEESANSDVSQKEDIRKGLSNCNSRFFWKHRIISA